MQECAKRFVKFETTLRWFYYEKCLEFSAPFTYPHKKCPLVFSTTFRVPCLTSFKAILCWDFRGSPLNFGHLNRISFDSYFSRMLIAYDINFSFMQASENQGRSYKRHIRVSTAVTIYIRQVVFLLVLK